MNTNIDFTMTESIPVMNVVNISQDVNSLLFIRVTINLLRELIVINVARKLHLLQLNIII